MDGSGGRSLFSLSLHPKPLSAPPPPLSPPALSLTPSTPPFSPPPPSQKIPMDTLDNILAAATAHLPPPRRLPWPPAGARCGRTYPIDLLKVDVEGYDAAALTAAPATLAASRLVLWECHALMQVRRGGPGTTHAAAAAALAAAGFESYKLARGPSVVRFDGAWADARHDAGDYMGWHNCVGVRRDDPLRRSLLRSMNSIKACEGAWGLREGDDASH